SFRFTALDALHFAAGSAANSIRGAFGLALRDCAPPDEYTRIFAPRISNGPSGFADAPRPFVFRVSHLEDLAIQPGGGFSIGVHLFDFSPSNLALFTASFERVASLGPSSGRSPARIRFDGADAPAPCAISLAPAQRISQTTVRFVTPTELKAEGAIAT